MRDPRRPATCSTLHAVRQRPLLYVRDRRYRYHHDCIYRFEQDKLTYPRSMTMACILHSATNRRSPRWRGHALVENSRGPKRTRVFKIRVCHPVSDRTRFNIPWAIGSAFLSSQSLLTSPGGLGPCHTSPEGEDACHWAVSQLLSHVLHVLQLIMCHAES